MSSYFRIYLNFIHIFYNQLFKSVAFVCEKVSIFLLIKYGNQYIESKMKLYAS